MHSMQLSSSTVLGLFAGVSLCFLLALATRRLPGTHSDTGKQQHTATSPAGTAQGPASDTAIITEKFCLDWLHANMPKRDRHKLTDKQLRRHIRLALAARGASPWAAAVPVDLWLNDVLPYRSVDEPLDEQDWRPMFYEKFMPLVAEANSLTEAAQVLNRCAHCPDLAWWQLCGPAQTIMVYLPAHALQLCISLRICTSSRNLDASSSSNCDVVRLGCCVRICSFCTGMSDPCISAQHPKHSTVMHTCRCTIHLPAPAAHLSCRDIWAIWDLHFVPDQTPEIMSVGQVLAKGYASCTGLSIFLVNACRAVGIPARIAGVLCNSKCNSLGDSGLAVTTKAAAHRQPTAPSASWRASRLVQTRLLTHEHVAVLAPCRHPQLGCRPARFTRGAIQQP